MAEAKTSCPKCGGHIAYPKELAGEEAPCPHCNENILLPTFRLPIAWVMAGAFALVTVCLASILVWEHLTDRAMTSPQVRTVEKATSSPIRVAENRNSQPVGLQKDPLVTGQLMNAVQYGGSVETIKLLLKKGADLNAKDNDGWHPLQLAAKRGDVEIVRLLLENGAKVNATNDYGATALESAAYRGYVDIVKLLVENGANVNAKDKYKLTPLMLAAENGNTNAIKLLLKNGADINAEDWMGQNALDDARQKKNEAIVQLLRKAGATESSATKQDEAISNDLKNLQRSTENLSNSWRRFQQAGAIASAIPDKPTFEVLSSTAKVTERNDLWWRFGYRVTVRNNGINTHAQLFEIQFLDAQGYVIDSTYTRMAIKPGTTQIITGDTVINVPGAARVSSLKAIWQE